MQRQGWNGKNVEKREHTEIYIEQIENLNNSYLLNWICHQKPFHKKISFKEKNTICTFLN